MLCSLFSCVILNIIRCICSLWDYIVINKWELYCFRNKTIIIEHESFTFKKILEFKYLAFMALTKSHLWVLIFKIIKIFPSLFCRTFNLLVMLGNVGMIASKPFYLFKINPFLSINNQLHIQIYTKNILSKEFSREIFFHCPSIINPPLDHSFIWF